VQKYIKKRKHIDTEMQLPANKSSYNIAPKYLKLNYAGEVGNNYTALL